jgi:hypothetical protein
VVENLLLRVAEVLVIMDRTCAALGLDAIFAEKRERDRAPKDPAFRLAWDLRHGRVAHRVERRDTLGLGPPSGHVREEFGDTVWAFLYTVLDGLEARLREIRSAGVPVRVPPERCEKAIHPLHGR